MWWSVDRFRVPILSPQRFGREVLALLPNGVAVARLDGQVRMANAAFGGLVGCAPEDLVGRPIDSLIESAVRVATPQLRHRTEIERRYETLPLVRCVPQEVIQVFLNRLLNAAQPIEESGTIRLVSRPDGDGVEVRGEDDGLGLDPGTLVPGGAT